MTKSIAVVTMGPEMFKRIDHIELLTAQPERAIAFYTGVLGFKVWGPVRRPSYARAEIRDADGNAIELRQWKKGSGPF